MLNKRYANRLQAMLVAAICILLVLLGRMAYMQLWRGDFYGDQADGNRLRRTKLWLRAEFFMTVTAKNWLITCLGM